MNLTELLEKTKAEINGMTKEELFEYACFYSFVAGYCQGLFITKEKPEP